MSKTTERLSVRKLFWQQVALNFIVVAVLIACGALLTFKVMGEEYSEWTVVGFFATVFFAFIVFLPAGTLFAARAEVAKDKVEVREDEKTGALAPIANPLLATAPLGVALAAIGTAIVYWLVYHMGWMPSPLVDNAGVSPLRRPLCDHRLAEHLPRYRGIGGAGSVPG